MHSEVSEHPFFYILNTQLLNLEATDERLNLNILHTILHHIMKSLSYASMAMERHKVYIAMLFIQFVYAGMALFSKAAISKGMNPFVFVVYRQAFATLALAPFAFFFERLNIINIQYELSFAVLQSYCFNLLDFSLIFLLNLQFKRSSSFLYLTHQDFLYFLIWVMNFFVLLILYIYIYHFSSNYDSLY